MLSARSAAERAGRGGSRGDRPRRAHRGHPPGLCRAGRCGRRAPRQDRRALPQPSDPALDQAKQAFAATVAAWSKVEILRFGPVTEDHRYERLFYLAGPQGHRPEADAGRTRRERRERGTARRACRQERRASGPAGARISALWRRRRNPRQGTPDRRRRGVAARGRHRGRVPLWLRARRRHQYRPHRRRRGGGLARGLGL